MVQVEKPFCSASRAGQVDQVGIEEVCINHDDSFLADIPANEMQLLYVHATVRASLLNLGNTPTREQYNLAN
jgi:hypothetical protein